MTVRKTSKGYWTCEDDGQANSNIEVMLKDKVLLADEEGADGEECHVGPGDASLGIEGLEPLIGEDAHADRGLLNRPHSGNQNIMLKKRKKKTEKLKLQVR